MPTEKVHIFTNSLLNLKRIKRGLGKCKPWEEILVWLIHENEEKVQSLYVLNPADLPRQDCLLSELFERLLFWKQGPDFLKFDQSEWAKQPKSTGSSDLIMQHKDEWGRDVQIYLEQIRAEKIEAEEEATIMAA